MRTYLLLNLFLIGGKSSNIVSSSLASTSRFDISALAQDTQVVEQYGTLSQDQIGLAQTANVGGPIRGDMGEPQYGGTLMPVNPMPVNPVMPIMSPNTNFPGT